MTEKTLKSECVFTGRVFTVSVDAVLLPDGRESIRERIHHNGGVCVLALTEDGTVPMVRQFRYGAGIELLEIPAGKLEKGENPEECGRRELAEECGLIAETFVSLGKVYPTPAYCGEVIHMFLAQGLSKTDTKLDEDEFLIVEHLSFDELFDKCICGEIEDAKTVAAVFRASNFVR